MIEVFVFISKDLSCWDWSRKQLSLQRFPLDNPHCLPLLRRSSHQVSLHSSGCTFEIWKVSTKNYWFYSQRFLNSESCTREDFPFFCVQEHLLRHQTKVRKSGFYKNNLKLGGISHLNARHSLVAFSQSVPDVDHVLPGTTGAALRHGRVGGVGDAVEQ